MLKYREKIIIKVILYKWIFERVRDKSIAIRI